MHTGRGIAVAVLAVAGLVFGAGCRPAPSGSTTEGASSPEQPRASELDERGRPKVDEQKAYLVVSTAQGQGDDATRASAVDRVWVLSGAQLLRKEFEGAHHVFELGPGYSCPDPQRCNPCRSLLPPTAPSGCPWPPPPIIELDLELIPGAKPELEAVR
jgi:hypothetical protein